MLAGLIDRPKSGSLEFEHYNNKINESYREKMILKEHLLVSNGVKFLIIYGDDMLTDRYKRLFQWAAYNRFDTEVAA